MMIVKVSGSAYSRQHQRHNESSGQAVSSSQYLLRQTVLLYPYHHGEHGDRSVNSARSLSIPKAVVNLLASIVHT